MVPKPIDSIYGAILHDWELYELGIFDLVKQQPP